MKHLKRFLVAVFAATALLSIPLQAQWIISTPTHICNDTIPQDSLWIVVNGGILYIDPGCSLTIFGTLRIAPGGEVRILTNAYIDVNPPQGLIIMDPYNPLLPEPKMRIYTNAVLYINTGRFVDMGLNSRIEFMAAGFIKIMATGYIRMSGSIINQSPLSAGLGLIDTQESNPFRGSGTIEQVSMLLHNGLRVLATDNLTFKEGGKMTYDCLSPVLQTLRIYGIAQWTASGTPKQYTFADCLAGITVYNGGSMYGDNTIFDSVPNLTGNTGSYMQFGSGALHMRHLTQIATKGTFMAKGMTFDATNGRTWLGIDIIGTASLLGLYESLVTDIALYENGVHLYDATNISNEIYRTTIQCLFGPMGSGGIGIYLEGNPLSIGISKLTVTCSDVNGFKAGVYNYLGDLIMDGVDIYLNNVGLYVSQGTAKVTRSLIRNNIGDGIVADNIPPRRPGLFVKKSAVIGNQGYQFNLLNTGNVYADSCNIYYRTGNNTAVIVRASTSIADMPRNWWGIFPTVPVQFLLLGGSTVTHIPEMAAPYIIDRGCVYPKQGVYNLTDPVELPAELEVRNYPNPFNPSTIIEYTIPADGKVLLKVYDALGKAVTTLVQEQQNAGTHRVEFKASSDLPSGLYMYEVITESGVGRGSMMLMK